MSDPSEKGKQLVNAFGESHLSASRAEWYTAKLDLVNYIAALECVAENVLHRPKDFATWNEVWNHLNWLARLARTALDSPLKDQGK